MSDVPTRNNVVVGNRYRHFKGGRYEVLAIGLLEKTQHEMVVYRSDKDMRTWIRPLDEFCEMLPIPMNGHQRRFEPVKYWCRMGGCEADAIWNYDDGSYGGADFREYQWNFCHAHASMTGDFDPDDTCHWQKLV